MQILKLTLLVAAVLFFSIGSANAFRVDMVATATDQGGAHSGTSILDVGDTVSVAVSFDTEGALSSTNTLLLLGLGLEFDNTIFSYIQPASTTPSSLLYTTPEVAHLVPASNCVGACAILPLPPFNQVQLDFLSSQIQLGSVGTPNNSLAGGESLGTYSFSVIASGDGIGEIQFSFAPATGGILHTSTGGQPLTLGGGTSFITSTTAPIVPEPGAALVFAVGITVVAARIRVGPR